MNSVDRFNLLESKGINTRGSLIEIGSLIVRADFIASITDEHFECIVKEYEQEMLPVVIEKETLKLNTK